MIEIQNLYKSFGKNQVLKGINLTIQDGEIYGLVGISGAGKSTLLRCINGLETYDEGTLLVDGVDIKSLKKKELRQFRKKVGMVFQQFSLMDRKTVYDNVAMPMRCFHYNKKEIDQKVKKLLELVELSDKFDAYPPKLSGGQKQRVAIARALTMDPEILLCDEATSALDPNITESILQLLRKINEEIGITIIVVTHQMDVVKEICHKMAVLSHGVLKLEGEVADIFLNQSDQLSDFFTMTPLEENGDPDEIRITIVQQAENETLLSSLSRETGVRFSIVWGGLSRYRNDIAGNYVLQFAKSDFETVRAFLEKEHIEWRGEEHV